VLLLLVSMVVLAAVVGVGLLVWRGADRQGQAMTIPDSTPSSNPRALPPPTSSGTQKYAAPFVTAVSDDGRHFVDQGGQPLLVSGDSPWSLLVDLSPAEAREYLDTRAEQGFNAIIVSLIGAEANGGPSDDGATYDGVVPFVEGDILDWNPDYWQRVHEYLEIAASKGITAFLYPIDGWTIGKSFSPGSESSCEEFGTRVAQYFADLPNIVWVMGGDYFPATENLAQGSDVDHCMDNALRGIRSTGDTRPFSIQLGYDKSVSTENPFWAPRVDWNFVYTYYPTYAAVLQAHRAADKPALFCEGNYEGENNQPETSPTTDETLRRQALWALTSGSPGEFYGSQDWRFEEGWQGRLESSGTRQLNGIRDFFRTLPWWRLVPDDQRPVVTGGRGKPAGPAQSMDVLDSDYVTAASTPDGGTTVVYIPTARTIQLDLDRLPARATAIWFDPSSAQTSPAMVRPSMTTPGPNSSGDGDWLLVVRSPG
jgi:hypothetical protein